MAERHRCGGTLKPSRVDVSYRKGNIFYYFVADGLVCDQCGEELIERETAARLEEQAPQAVLVDVGDSVAFGAGMLASCASSGLDAFTPARTAGSSMLVA